MNHIDLSCDEVSFEEKKFYAERTLPKISKNSFAMIPALLKTALFSSTVRGTRQQFTAFTDISAPAGYRIEYKGEELRQDDLRVLLALIKRNAGQIASNAISFVARSFCRDELGWADSGDSVAKLRACLVRMHDARIHVHGPKFFGMLSLVSDAVLTDEGVWLVNLGASVAEAMPQHPTYLNVGERLGMKDGLESWLYGYVKADACFAPIDRAELRKLSGCSYEQKDFNKHLSALLSGFAAQGVIAGSEVVKGRLHIKKATA